MLLASLTGTGRPVPFTVLNALRPGRPRHCVLRRRIAELDFFSKGSVNPITGFAIIFVSYAGFQLLVYDYEDTEDVEQTLPNGMLVAIIPIREYICEDRFCFQLTVPRFRGKQFTYFLTDR